MLKMNLEKYGVESKQELKEKLIDLYYNQHLDTTKISKIFGVRPTCICKWFKKFGLKTRTLPEQIQREIICKCGSRFIAHTWRQKLCRPCFKEKRKQDKRNRYHCMPKQKRKQYYEKTNIQRIANRKIWIDNELCYDCGKKKEQKEIKRCNNCHEIGLKSSEKYNRKRGICKAGGSRHQKLVFNIATEMFPGMPIEYNYRKAIRNPKTGKPLELDIFFPTKKVAIEVDGPMHFIPVYGPQRLRDQQEYDLATDNECLKKNIRLIRLGTTIIEDGGDPLVRQTLYELFTDTI